MHFRYMHMPLTCMMMGLILLLCIPLQYIIIVVPPYMYVSYPIIYYSLGNMPWPSMLLAHMAVHCPNSHRDNYH